MTPLGSLFNTLAVHLSQIIDKDFPDKCSISRPTTTVGDYGTGTPSYTSVATNIGCMVEPAGKDTMKHFRALKISAVAGYAITLPSLVGGVAIDIKPKDRIVVAARGAEVARTLYVAGPPLRNAGLSLLVLCKLEES